MKRTIPRIIALVVIAGLVLFGRQETLLAADEVGEIGHSPNKATAPLNHWVTLEDGSKHWYAFVDAGDENDVEVRVTTTFGDRAAFEIWTPEQLREWQNGDNVDAVGAGTVNENLSDDLFWTGNFVASGQYYVIVNSRNFGPVDYQLTIHGSDVAFPSAEVGILSDDADSEAATGFGGDVATGIRVTEESSALFSDSELGTHAGATFTPVGKSRFIHPGETHWYSFRDEGDEEAIIAVLDATPNVGVRFEVWTAGQLRQWQSDDEFDPVGAGTENEALEIKQYWTGSFVRSGNYYVIVRHTGLTTGSSHYSLSVIGNDVSY